MSNIVTVHYDKPNIFLKNAKLVKDENGISTPQGDYHKQSMPQVSQFKRPLWSDQKRRFLVNISQEELDKLVEQIGFVHEYGPRKDEMITRANLSNPRDPFFNNSECGVTFEAGKADFDRESAFGKFVIAWFDADYRFNVSDEKASPAMAGKIEYKVSTSQEQIKEDSKHMEQGLEANSLLESMSETKLRQVLTAMGVRMKNAEFATMRSLAYKKITDHKDVKVAGGKTNIELFLELAKLTTEELSMRSAVSKAYQYGILTRKHPNRYFYGQKFIGDSIVRVVENLSKEENEDIKNEIIRQVNERSS